MFFKYQFGKQYVYEIEVNTSNNLKLSLNSGIVLYLYVTQIFFKNFFNKNAILFSNISTANVLKNLGGTPAIKLNSH